jgi:hypothetical protein
LNKVFFGIVEQLFMWKLRQIIFFRGQQTFLMNLSHMAVSLSKRPRLILFGIENLNCIPNSPILVFGVCKFDNIFGLFVHDEI